MNQIHMGEILELDNLFKTLTNESGMDKIRTDSLKRIISILYACKDNIQADKRLNSHIIGYLTDVTVMVKSYIEEDNHIGEVSLIIADTALRALLKHFKYIENTK